LKFTGAAASVHKWLALVRGQPVLGWFDSGLFIAFVPEDAIHGNANLHAPPSIATKDVAGPLAARPGAYARIGVRTMFGRPVVQLTPIEGRPRVVGLRSGRRATPVDRATTGTPAAECGRRAN